MLRFRLYCFSLFFFTSFSFAQNSFSNFLKPPDSLNHPRRNAVIVSESILTAGILLSLNQLWYADYPKSDFHFINDNAEWLQMDKAGHVFSSYQLGRFSKELFHWSGMSRKNQLSRILLHLQRIQRTRSCMQIRRILQTAIRSYHISSIF